MLNYILWGPDPELFSLGILSVRWYGLLFASGFLFGQWILTKIYKNEGRKPYEVDTFTLYAVLGTVVGARLGHCLFYSPEFYLSNPIEILKIWEGGLASHGAAIGILLATYFYYRKLKIISYLWVVDRLVIVVALAGVLIRVGNFMNSEIIGKPTEASFGIVFNNSAERQLTRNFTEEVADVSFTKTNETTTYQGKTMPKLKMDVALNTHRIGSEKEALIFANEYIYKLYTQSVRIDERHIMPLKDTETRVSASGGQYIVSMEVAGIARHPTQLYEAFSYLLIFLVLLFLYKKFQAETPDGLLLGLFLILIFGARFIWEFLKEVQVEKELEMNLNLGQQLSIPLILAGIALVIRAIKLGKREISET